MLQGHKQVKLRNLLVSLALVQIALSAGQQFAAASVKPPAPGAEPYGYTEIPPGGRLVVSNSTLRELVLAAYDLRPFQLEGGPAWFASQRFDINATAGAQASRAQVMKMLQALLADRFGLRTRTVTRELPIYELRLARADRRLGPQLRPSSLDCAAAIPPQGVMDGAPLEGALEGCGLRTITRAGVDGVVRTLGRAGIRMHHLAAMLTPAAGRVIVDRTGLDGTYDVEFSWSPGSAQVMVSGGAPPITTSAPAEGMSLLSAVQTQLGMKLEPARGPVDVLVVETAERPQEN
jgi:uncharacterized protein (TIGR03435 family)